MTKFINRYGLLNPTSKDTVSENTLLTTLTYHQLLKVDKRYYWYKNADVLDSVEKYIYLCFRDGWYNQYPEDVHISNPDDEYMSPDQLLAIMLWLHILGREKELKTLARRILFQVGTYDNVSQDLNFKRMMQPQILALAGYFGISKWFFKHALILSVEFSFAGYEDDNTKTSGMQKAFVIMDVLFKESREYREYEKDFINALKYYYKEEDHPIRELLK